MADFPVYILIFCLVFGFGLVGILRDVATKIGWKLDDLAYAIKYRSQPKTADMVAAEAKYNAAIARETATRDREMLREFVNIVTFGVFGRAS